LALGCATEPPALECHFGQEHAIAAATLRFHGLQFAGSTLVYSSPEGLFVRPLPGDGSPREPARRVDAACDGGFHAEAEGERLVVGCLRRSTAKSEGSALLLEFRDGALRERVVLGPAGRDARGIDLAREADGWAAVWHDGVPGAWGVWFARFTDELELRSGPRLLSAPRVAAGRPSLHRGRNNGLWVTWAETWIDAGFPHGQIVVWPGRGVPRPVAEVDVLDPSPVLHHDERSAVLFFRDLRPPNRRTGLFAQRLDERWRSVGEPVRVGRSDGAEPFDVLRCSGALATVTPRSWDGDLLIGVNLLDSQLRKRVPEQQVYQWAARFATAAARCTGDTLLLIVGEQSRAPDTAVAAHALTLRCR